MRPIVVGMVLMGFAFASVGEARADRKGFAWTYPYMTLPEGSLELEHYLDVKLNDWDDPDAAEKDGSWSQVDWQHQVEVEYAVTDRLDFGLYNVFRQKPYGEFKYRGAKFRGRYRLAEEGALFVDPAAYMEVAYYGDEVKLEEMLILGRWLGPVQLALNIKVEQEYKLESESWKHEIIPTFAIGYHFTPRFSVGIEYYGKLEIEDGEAGDFQSYLGPTISVLGKKIWWTLGVQPALAGNGDGAEIQIRSVMGILF